MGGAVAEWVLERVDHQSIAVDGQSFERNGTSGHVAAKAFEFIALMVCKLTRSSKVLPTNTGAEAVESAIKCVRKWGYEVAGVVQDRTEVIVCTNGFHGRTISIVSFSTDPTARKNFGPFTPGFKIVPFGDGSALEDAITPNTVGFLVEPIQEEAGVKIPPAGYLKRAREICSRPRFDDRRGVSPGSGRRPSLL